MAKDFLYRNSFNVEEKIKLVDKSYTFDFGHTKGIKLNLVRDGAEILIPMKTKKTMDEFTSFKVA